MQVQQTNNVSPVRSLSYSEACKELEDLSVVLFYGEGMFSRLIRWAEEKNKGDDVTSTYGYPSHAGVLVSRNVFPNFEFLKNERWAVLEMTFGNGSDAVDLVENKGITGTQIRDFKEVVSCYPGDVAVMRLADNPLHKRPSDQEPFDHPLRVAKVQADAAAFYAENKDTRYQFNPLRLAASLVDKLRPVRHVLPVSDEWMSCGQLVAEFYKRIGVLSGQGDPEDVVPLDFIHDEDGYIRSGTFVLPPLLVLPEDPTIKEDSSFLKGLVGIAGS